MRRAIPPLFRFQASPVRTISCPQTFTMKFMILILTFAFALTESIQQPKIFRAAVFYDQQVVNMAQAKNDPTSDYVLRLVQKANNRLNKADMHIQLMINITMLEPIDTGNAAEQSWKYWIELGKLINPMFSPHSVNESHGYGNLTDYALILTSHPAVIHEPARQTVFKAHEPPCHHSDGWPSVAVVRVSSSPSELDDRGCDRSRHDCRTSDDSGN